MRWKMGELMTPAIIARMSKGQGDRRVSPFHEIVGAYIHGVHPNGAKMLSSLTGDSVQDVLMWAHPEEDMRPYLRLDDEKKVRSFIHRSCVAMCEEAGVEWERAAVEEEDEG